MKGVIRGHGEKTTYWLDGLQVSKAEFDAAFPDQPMGDGTGLVGFKPLASDALAVNPRQIPAAMADARKKGFNLDFTPDGRPVFTSSSQFKRYARRSGFDHKGYP